MRHHRLRPSAEQPEQVVDQAAVRRVAADHGLEDVRVTDLLGAADHLLGLQPIHHGLHRRVGRPAALRKGIVDFADGAGAVRPQRLHDVQLQPAQLRRRHRTAPPIGEVEPTPHVVGPQVRSSRLSRSTTSVIVTTTHVVLATITEDTRMAGEMQSGEGSLGLMKLIEQADALSIGVLIILSAMSLASWFVILTRLWDQRLIAKSVCRSAQEVLGDRQPVGRHGRAFRPRQRLQDAGRGRRARRAASRRDVWRSRSRSTIGSQSSLYRSIESVTSRLVNGLSVLATTGSVSPFVGLLGTVWGIYNALNGSRCRGRRASSRSRGRSARL